jgi:hypothetical protein
MRGIALAVRTICIIGSLIHLLPLGAHARPHLAVVPGLSGFGTTTVAGSGRHLRPPTTTIFIVSTLADSGRGSLRACAEAHGPRTCIFYVGGVISLTRHIKITSPYLTIAGQTAPNPGITLTNAGITVASHDVLIQHIAIRPGDSVHGAPPNERDGISVGAKPPQSTYNVVIDHVSMTWAIDENFSTAYPQTRDVTVANSIIAEGLHDSIHPKGPHSKGVMIGDDSKRITIKDNLIAFNEERNPYLKPGTSVEFINNLVYGWGPRGGWSLCNLTNNTDRDAPILLSFIGNVYRPSPSSALLPPLYAKKLDSRSVIYARDTVGPLSTTARSEPHLRTLPANVSASTAPPLASAFTRPIPAEEVVPRVLSSAGARPRHRATHDSRIMREVATSQGTIKDCTKGCPLSTGTLKATMRAFRPLRVPRHPTKDRDRDGYTNLENWLHKLAKNVEGGTR